MPRQKTVRAFEEWVTDAANIDEVLRRVMGGTKLSKLCAEIKRPYTLLYPYLHSTPELKARYEAALAGRADDLMHETLEIADSVRGTAEAAEVSAAKLAVETRQKLAAGWNRDRYGETLRVERPAETPSDAGLLGFASELLKLVKSGAAPSAPAEKLIGEGSVAEPGRAAGAAATALARAVAE